MSDQQRHEVLFFSWIENDQVHTIKHLMEKVVATNLIIHC